MPGRRAPDRARPAARSLHPPRRRRRPTSWRPRASISPPPAWISIGGIRRPEATSWVRRGWVMSVPEQYNSISLAASAARIAGSRRSSSLARASPNVRSTSGENRATPAGCSTSGCSRRSTARWPPAESPAMTIAVGGQALRGAQPVPAGADVDRRGGESVAWRQPVVEAEHRKAGQAGQPRRQPAVGARGAQGVSAAVQVVDAPVVSSASRVGLRRTPAPRTHSPTTRLPSGSRTSTGSICVPASDGPKESMILAMIWRDAHRPHARSGGSTALICRRVNPLTAAAPRDRIDPRAGIVSVVTR